MNRKLLVSSAVAALLIAGAAGPAAAQDQQQQPAQQQPAQQQQQQAGQQQQIAQQCLEDLRSLARQMEEEGFWLTGWGWRWGPGPAMTPRTPVAGPATTARPTDQPRPGETGTEGTAPWAVTGPQPLGINSPRFQIRSLYSAANVLAYRGDEQGCQTVLEELQSAYDQFTTQLREAGVEPGEVTSWRQERITAAVPVEQLQQRRIVTIDDITGTDVRNLQDEDLGSVDDVVLDPESGEISYVIVARDGFLGVGEDHVAVPWQQFRATTGVNLLVLDISEDQLEQAPEIDPERFSDPQTFAETRQRTDAFWEQQG